MIAKTPSPFARFFRAVPGHIVSRYGTATPTTSNQRIGVRRTQTEIPGRESALMRDVSLEWTDEIVAITHDEARRFKREYDSHVKDKALVEVSEADYNAYIAKENAAAEKHVADEKAAKEKVEAEAKAAEEAKAKADAAPAPSDASSEASETPSATGAPTSVT